MAGEMGGHSPHHYHIERAPEKGKQHRPQERRKPFATERPSERRTMTLVLLGAELGKA